MYTANSEHTFLVIEDGLEAIEMVSLDCTSAEGSEPWHSDSEIKIERDSAVTINGHTTKNFWDGKIILTISLFA